MCDGTARPVVRLSERIVDDRGARQHPSGPERFVIVSRHAFGSLRFDHVRTTLPRCRLYVCQRCLGIDCRLEQRRAGYRRH